MGNYLQTLGLGFIYEDLDAMSGMIGHVLQNGKPIHNYYGLPYLNEHFGSTQIVCRVGPTPEGDKLQFTGFDSHADSLCCWKFRIEHKVIFKDDEDLKYSPSQGQSNLTPWKTATNHGRLQMPAIGG